MQEEKKPRRYRVAPGPDIDLEREDVRDVRGNRITQDYVDRAVAGVHRRLEVEGRAVGRPSMSGPGRKSPATAVRLPEALRAAVEARAKREGRKVSEVIREAIERYVSA